MFDISELSASPPTSRRSAWATSKCSGFVPRRPAALRASWWRSNDGDISASEACLERAASSAMPRRSAPMRYMYTARGTTAGSSVSMPTTSQAMKVYGTRAVTGRPSASTVRAWTCCGRMAARRAPGPERLRSWASRAMRSSTPERPSGRTA